MRLSTLERPTIAVYLASLDVLPLARDDSLSLQTLSLSPTSIL